MEEKILLLHSEGFTNREIASRIPCSHSNVNYWLRKQGLKSNWTKSQPIKMVGDDLAECSKCLQVLSLSEFFYGRKGQKYEYRFSYCKSCRKKQLYLNLNNNLSSLLRDKFNKTKRRALLNQIPFDISFKEWESQYNRQGGFCFYTDEIMVARVGEGILRNTLSVDKIIPERGYVKGNFVFCTYRVNTAKSDFQLEELQKWMPMWYTRAIQYITESSNLVGSRTLNPKILDHTQAP